MKTVINISSSVRRQVIFFVQQCVRELGKGM